MNSTNKSQLLTCFVVLFLAKRRFCQGVNSLQTHQLVFEQQPDLCCVCPCDHAPTKCLYICAITFIHAYNISHHIGSPTPHGGDFNKLQYIITKVPNEADE